MMGEQGWLLLFSPTLWFLFLIGAMWLVGKLIERKVRRTQPEGK